MSSINDSKSFWAKLKTLTNKCKLKLSNNITEMEWLIHFENLFANPDEHDAFEDIEIEEPDIEIEELIFNSEITDDEIVFAVKSLKTGKSPGTDGIIPEITINILKLFYRYLTKYFTAFFRWVSFQNYGVSQL